VPDDGAASAREVGSDDRVIALLAEIDDLGAGCRRHLRHVGIIGVEDRGSARLDAFDQHLLDPGKVLYRIHARKAEVVRTDVGHHADAAPIKAESLAQNAAARRFQDRDLDARMQQYGAGALWPRTVAREDLSTVDVGALGGRHAHEMMRGLEHVGDEPRHGRLAIGACDADDGDTSGRA